AHDCHVGDDTIFGNMATLGGHVAVEDFANVSAGSDIHQFCRVGRHAFIGGYSVVTKDALPFPRTVGSRPARIYGRNTIGMTRRGLIAGNGRFPLLVLDAARGAGHDVTIIAIEEETFPELAEAAARPPAAALHWISLGQLGACIRLLEEAGVTQAVMAGQVKH